MRRLLTILAALSLFAVPAAWAQSARDGLLVTAAWLAGHVNDANLVLLHVGPKPEYDAMHIPGARFLSLADLSVTDRSPGGLTLQLPAPDDLRQRLQALGISNSSRIVVYFGHENPSVSPVARVMFTLDYAGLGAQASVLDGGLDAWTGAGQATTTDVPPARTGTLAPLAVRDLVVDADWVKARLGTPGVAIIDSRTPAFYSGEQTGGGQATPHKAGHIAGAGSVPFSSTVDEANRLKSAADLQKAFADAGVKPGDTIVAYCHIGQQATQVVLAARSLGYTVRLYDGSFEDWSRRDYPVDNPAAKKQ